MATLEPKRSFVADSSESWISAMGGPGSLVRFFPDKLLPTGPSLLTFDRLICSSTRGWIAVRRIFIEGERNNAMSSLRVCSVRRVAAMSDSLMIFVVEAPLTMFVGAGLVSSSLPEPSDFASADPGMLSKAVCCLRSLNRLRCFPDFPIVTSKVFQYARVRVKLLPKYQSDGNLAERNSNFHRSRTSHQMQKKGK